MKNEFLSGNQVLCDFHIMLFEEIFGVSSCCMQPRGGFIYFTIRGRVAEQGIIFRIPTPGQGIIFVEIGFMTGCIYVIFDSERSF